MSDNKDKEEEKPVVAKTAVDLQRLKLMKLMKNPEKPILLPERPKAKNTPTVPEFVRNVMGSSAGAGSGEFHVYRHLRRKEYARQKFIQEKGRKELLDEEYHKKLEENKRMAEEVTAKKRAKRLKKKQKWKQKKKMKTPNIEKDNKSEHTSTDDDTSDNEELSNASNPDTVPKDVAKDNDTEKSTSVLHLDEDKSNDSICQNESQVKCDVKEESCETVLKDEEPTNECTKSKQNEDSNSNTV